MSLELIVFWSEFEKSFLRSHKENSTLIINLIIVQFMLLLFILKYVMIRRLWVLKWVGLESDIL